MRRNRVKNDDEKGFSGYSVKVYNNNIEFALEKLKRKLKDSNWILELRRKEYYRKPSAIKREQINKAKLRTKWQNVEQKKEF